ncbi:MAG TPA: hypothetical protein VGG64_09970 [Pirellulales bacterium]|jgi:hypothetical protein
MDEHEEELLLHIAAGTDLWTALAALPLDEYSTATPENPRKLPALVVLTGVLAMIWLLW